MQREAETVICQHRQCLRRVVRWIPCVLVAVVIFGCQRDPETYEVEARSTSVSTTPVASTTTTAVPDEVVEVSVASIAAVTLGRAGSDDDFDPVFVELYFGSECVVGIDRFGRDLPLAFAHGEQLDLTAELPAIAGVLHWPRDVDGFGRAEVGPAHAGDLLLVDRQFHAEDIAEWTTLPNPSCSLDGLVVVHDDPYHGEFDMLPGAVHYVFGAPQSAQPRPEAESVAPLVADSVPFPDCERQVADSYTPSEEPAHATPELALRHARVHLIWAGDVFVELERSDTEVLWEIQDDVGTPLGIVTATVWTDDTWVVESMRGCFVDPSRTHSGIATR